MGWLLLASPIERGSLAIWVVTVAVYVEDVKCSSERHKGLDMHVTGSRDSVSVRVCVCHVHTRI